MPRRLGRRLPADPLLQEKHLPGVLVPTAQSIPDGDTSQWVIHPEFSAALNENAMNNQLDDIGKTGAEEAKQVMPTHMTDREGEWLVETVP